MLRPLFRALLILVMATGAALAQPITMDSFIAGYYRSPDPAEAVDRLAALDFDSYLPTDDAARREHGIVLLSTFYAHVLHKAPDAADRLIGRTISAEDPEKALVAAIAIARSGMSGSAVALDRLARAGALPDGVWEGIRAMQPYPFPTMDPRTHPELDVMWMSFFATGDALYVERVAGRLAALDEAELAAGEVTAVPGENPLIDTVAAVGAYWSLEANARQDDSVLSILRRIAEERSDKVGRIAGMIVEEVSAGR
ncbi:hypothetical protein [Inquilinus sp. CAU 1745]|uniref:hypothetical protein n=1 Tax=Inquilinus sp. CAU 1745 TaxID=3140369 RepID=UPI00325B4AAF